MTDPARDIEPIQEDAEDEAVDQSVNEDLTLFNRPLSADATGTWVEDDGPESQRPATATGNMPSQTGQPRLTRTPHTTSSQASPGSDSEDDGEGDGVLITEVKGDPEPPQGEVHLRRLRRRRPQEKQATPVDDGAEYDTDLEIDEKWMNDFLGKKEKKKKPKKGEKPSDEHDPTGRLNYQRLCEKMGVVPVSYFCRHITDPEITMRYHGLGPQGTRAIARVLRESITVERLNLAGNWMEGEGGMHMARMLSENEYITDLTLADNKLGTVGSYHISRMMQVNSGLRRLDLSCNDIGDADAENIAQAIENNKFLKELNLSHNNFGEEGGDVLGPAIGANDILEIIDLSWNQLRRSGAVSIARGIKENIRLKRCNLSWNGFGPEGGAAIADAIGVNDALRELDISGNRLDGHCGFLIAKGLRKNEELRILKMGNNPISTTGAIAIVTALNENENTLMEELHLTDIPVEYEFLRVSEEVARRREGFTATHGPVLRSGNTPEDIGKPAIDPYPKDPLIVLRDHIVVNDFRILDILKRHDAEGMLSVTPEQFTIALEELGVRYTKAQIDEIAEKLNTQNDDRIYYGDILREVEAQQAALAAAQSQSAVTPNSSRRPSNTDVNVPITRETADVANRSTTDMKTAVQTTTVDGTPTKRVGTMNYTNSQEITVEQ